MTAIRPAELLSIPEDATPPGLHRLWTRRITAGQIFEDEPFDELFLPAQDQDETPSKSRTCTPTPRDLLEVSDPESDVERGSCCEDADADVRPLMCLDGASLGDIPARYVIPSLPNHEFPVIGVFVDSRVVPGFRYKVRVLPDSDRPHRKSYLFGGKALTLQSIGRGYSRRICFEADASTTLNENDNYFWADSRCEGFGMEVQVVCQGDKFTARDPGQVVAASVEVVTLLGPQEEVSHVVLQDGSVEKTVKVRVMCKVEWFDDGGSTVLMPVSGIAVCVKKKGAAVAEIQKIKGVTIGSHQHRRGFTLTKGVKTQWRRKVVSGAAIGDVPCQYTITGLESHEHPVIGTYVDARIVPGFRYHVRPANSKKRLFDGQPLGLVSVGMGYGKRISFEAKGDEETHFWSDSSPDGFGFESVAVDTGMKFRIEANGLCVGHADVFRNDRPQVEVAHVVERTTQGAVVMKHIQVDMTCHVSLASHAADTVMRVRGTAVVARDSRSRWAKLMHIENIGLDSQINLVFVREHDSLLFLPL